jgi:hypothetical protein
MGGWFQLVLYSQYLALGLLFLGHVLVTRSTDSSRTGRWSTITISVAATLLVLSANHPHVRRLCLSVLLGFTAWRLVASRSWTVNVLENSAAYVRPLIVGMGVLSILLYLSMGITREAARRPDTVLGKISLQDQLRLPLQLGGHLP